MVPVSYKSAARPVQYLPPAQARDLFHAIKAAIVARCEVTRKAQEASSQRHHPSFTYSEHCA
jgi:hypothetical protein